MKYTSNTSSRGHVVTNSAVRKFVAYERNVRPAKQSMSVDLGFGITLLGIASAVAWVLMLIA